MLFARAGLLRCSASPLRQFLPTTTSAGQQVFIRRRRGDLGFVAVVSTGSRILYLGDTEGTPEKRRSRNIDWLCLA